MPEQDVNSTDHLSWTQLHYASLNNDVQRAKDLIRNGADVNKCDRHNRTPLALAAIKDNVEVLRVLLSHKADPNLGTPLHHACFRSNVDVVLELLKHGADPNAKDGKGRPPVVLTVFLPKPPKTDKEIIQILNLLVKFGADINAGNLENYTCLHIAAENGIFDIIKEIIKLGANPNILTVYNQTALIRNIVEHRDKADQIKFLIESGTDVNWDYNKKDLLLEYCQSIEVMEEIIKHFDDINWRNVDNETCLLYNMKYNAKDIVRRLLNVDNGQTEEMKGFYDKIEVNIHSYSGWTPLHYAVLKEDEDIVRALLNKGANVNALSHNGILALHIAVVTNNTNIAKILLDYGSFTNLSVLDVTNISILSDEDLLPAGFTPLQQASNDDMKNLLKDNVRYFDRTETLNNARNEGLENLSDAPDLLGWTRLHHAVYARDIQQINILINLGCNLSPVDHYNRTPLSIAAMHNHIEILKILLKAKANVDMGLPLHYSVRHGHFESVTELIKSGASVNLLDRFDRTPLHIATYFDYDEIAEFLLENGADVNNLRDDCQELPIHIACSENNLYIVNHLLNHGADPNVKSLHDTTPLMNSKSLEIVKALLEKNADIHAIDDEGCTALQLFAGYHNVECAKELCKRGSNVNLQDVKGLTALHKCVEDLETLEVLLEHNANPNIADSKGFTPLHFACYKGNLEVVKKLIQYRADVNFPSADHVLPIYLASARGCIDVVRELIICRSHTQIAVDDLTISSASFKRKYCIEKGKTAADIADSEEIAVMINSSDSIGRIYECLDMRILMI